MRKGKARQPGSEATGSRDSPRPRVLAGCWKGAVSKRKLRDMLSESMPKDEFDVNQKVEHTDETAQGLGEPADGTNAANDNDARAGGDGASAKAREAKAGDGKKRPKRMAFRNADADLQAEIAAVYTGEADSTAREFGIAVCQSRLAWTQGLIDTLLRLMNQDHAVVSVGGSTRYIHQKTGPDGQPEIHFLHQRDMDTMYAAVLIRSKMSQSRAEKPRKGSFIRIRPKKTKFNKAQNAFALWSKWAGRRQYAGIDMFPPPLKAPHGYFNLWRGFAIEPRAGDWSLFREHLREKVCGGNEVVYDWLIDWMAQTLQEPGKKMGTAVAMKSAKKGTGKSLVLQVFKRIFGSHAISVSKSNQVVGNFNSHLKGVILLGVEEAIWGGDKKAEGALKDLITGDRLAIEPKGVDVFDVANFTRAIFTSNNDWVFPVGIDERRVLMLEVENDRAKDRSYFEPLFRQMFEEGGVEAMLHDLLRHGFKSDLRNPPETDALREQRQRSLSGLSSWLLEIAKSGEIANLPNNHREVLKLTEHTRVPCGDIIEAAKRSVRHYDAAGVHTDVGTLLKSVRVEKKRPGSGDRREVYVFPPLNDLRAEVEKVLRVPCPAEPIEEEPVPKPEHQAMPGSVFLGGRIGPQRHRNHHQLAKRHQTSC